MQDSKSGGEIEGNGFNRISGMPLEALALERMNGRHIDIHCGCMIVLMQVWMAKPC